MGKTIKIKIGKGVAKNIAKLIEDCGDDLLRNVSIMDDNMSFDKFVFLEFVSSDENKIKDKVKEALYGNGIVDIKYLNK